MPEEAWSVEELTKVVRSLYSQLMAADLAVHTLTEMLVNSGVVKHEDFQALFLENMRKIAPELVPSFEDMMRKGVRNAIRRSVPTFGGDLGSDKNN